MKHASSEPARTSAPDRDAAWRALQRGAVLAPLPLVGGLRVTGDDRVDFLQGQLAADVRGLAEGGARRSLVLDAKGHARAEATVYRRPDDLYLAVEDGALPWLEGRLRKHVIFDAVEIEAMAGVLCTSTLQGPAAGEVLTVLGWPEPREGSSVAVPFGAASLLLSARARSAAGGVDVHLLCRQAGEVREALLAAGAVPADAATLEPSRIAAGLPRAGVDAGEGVLPQEAGLHDAFSTRKGCYLGQEIMARIEARGRLKRGLAGLSFESDAGSPRLPGLPGAPLLRGGRTVGRAGSAALHPSLGGIGLAVVRHDVEEGEILEVGGMHGIRARRVPLPFPAILAP